MNKKILTNSILLFTLIYLITLKTDLSGISMPKISETEKLLRWNVVGFGISTGTIKYPESHTIGKGMGMNSTILGIDFFLPEYKIGGGTALIEFIFLPSNNMDTPERVIYSILPVKLYIPLYHSEWGPKRFKFANTIDLFGETSLGITYEKPINLNCGIEWCPGLLTNFRIGYARIFRNNVYSSPHDESSIYASLSLFLGAINKLGGDR